MPETKQTQRVRSGREDVLLAAVVRSSAARLTFADGMHFSVTPEALGIDEALFDLSTAKMIEGGSGFTLQRQRSLESAVFDAASLRCRVDPIYAKTVRESIDALYRPKSAQRIGSPPTKAWFDEDHANL